MRARGRVYPGENRASAMQGGGPMEDSWACCWVCNCCCCPSVPIVVEDAKCEGTLAVACVCVCVCAFCARTERVAELVDEEE